MPFLTIRTLQRLPLQALTTRPLSTSSASLLAQQMGSNPASNLPDPAPNSSAAPNAAVRSDTQNTDAQSSASHEEHKTGDDHPAKQPDQQAQPTRSTGIGGDTEVRGGKEGLGERGDK